MATKKSSTSKISKSAQQQAVKFASQHKKGVAVFLCTLLVIIIAAALIVYFCFPQLWQKAVDAYTEYTRLYYNDSSDDDPPGTLAKVSDPVPTGDLASISTAEFSIHFLELGNKYAGDSTLIKCGDTEILIDAGSRTNSAPVICEYVNQYCTDNKLEYVIATHAHQDHIAGFIGTGSGNNKSGILYQYEVGTIIQFSEHNSTSGVYNNYVAAVAYAESQGAVAYTALECWNNAGKKDTQSADDTRAAQRQYVISDNLTLNILYNYYYEHTTSDENDYSVCVLLTYTADDGTESNYLFTGDLEGKGEEYLVDMNTLPKVVLFKGGHHGSKTSTTDKLLNVIQPKYVAVCCCAGSTEYTTNNDNTFPTQDFINRVSKWTDNVFVTSLCIDYKGGNFTSMNGNIVFYYDEEAIKLWCSNNTTKLKDTEWFAENRQTPAAWQ